MKRQLIAGLAVFALATAATAQTVFVTPPATGPGVTGAVGGTAAVQNPGVMTSPAGGWSGYQPGMTAGYNPYGGSNYGGYQPAYHGGVMQTGYASPTGYSGYPQYAGGYGMSYGGGCGAMTYSQPVVYSEPASSGCGCGKKKRKLGLFR